MKSKKIIVITAGAIAIVSSLTACDNRPTEGVKPVGKVSESQGNANIQDSNSMKTEASKTVDVASQALDDSQITAKVKAALLNEPGLRSTKIEVVTTKGVVRLSGNVNSQENKEKAIAIAGLTQGVTGVESELAIKK